MIQTIKGNILTQKQGVIVHQTNCSGGFGGGLAGQIARKYPEVRKAYFKLYYENQAKPTESLLGSYQSVKVGGRLTIVNMFSQYYYASGPNDTTVYTDYEAMEKVLRQLNKDVPEGVPIYFPSGIGCGLANGHWGTVHKLLNKCFKDRKDVYIVELF